MSALRAIVVLMFILVGVMRVTAQVDFKPRTSSKAPAPYTGVKNYNLQGDFTMIGNTNLTLKNYYESGDNASNSKPMIYVDVDGDNKTKNSSSAQLLLPGGECTEIIYAGLYWTGRAQRSNNSSWTIDGLDKRQVKLKKSGLSYQNITANTVGGQSEILFPTNNNSYIYTAYADVTDYVRKNGVGNYFVADIALDEGSSPQDGTGYFGGWGMVVIYKNTSLKWRNITVFDGYGYMTSSVGSKELAVSGFQAVQQGAVKIKLGMMAGEGDVSIPGDYFDIKNIAGNWRRIKKEDGTTSTPGASTPNFFNSSILTGGNSRSPDLKNNTGIDIVMFDLDNPNNTIIKNNQSSSTFGFGSTQDTYVIHNIVFAVDAYVPEVVGENKPTNYGGATPSHQGTILPGQQFEFELDVKNKGTEVVKNTKIEIPVPFNLHYVGSDILSGFPAGGTASWRPPVGAPSGAMPQNTPGGTIVWTVGQLPLDSNRDKILAKLKYRFRVSDNCILLSTNVCGLEVRINGNITGTGATSGTTVNSDLVRDYGNGDCAGPVYDDFTSKITLSADFLQGCSPPVENGMRQFKAFCELTGNAFARNEIIDEYPAGTKFFDQVPDSYDSNTGLITGTFPVSTTSGEKLTYYAVVPGMDPGCYLKLQTSLEKVTTSPVAKDIEICKGEEVLLDIQLSQAGQTNGYNLYYFNSDGTQQLSEAPKPTAVGTYSYKVAEGKKQGEQICFGSKVDFKIVINDLPTVAATEANVSLCENNDHKITINTTGATVYVWEYTTSTAPNSWQTLSNSTFSNNISVSNNTLNILHAPKVINGLKVRLKVDNGKCPAVSNEILIEVKDCRVITNPMLPNKAKKVQ